MQELIDQFKAWVNESLNKPEPFLNSIPVCPYARDAVLRDRFKWEVCGSDLRKSLESSIEAFVSSGKEAVIFVDATKHSATSLESCVKELREKYFKQNIWVLYDHPDLPEIQGELQFNYGSCALVILQNLKELVAASDELAAKGYYKNWSQEYFDQVVVERRRYLSRLQALSQKTIQP